MANSKISALTAQTTLASTDMLVVANSGSTTKKITAANLKTDVLTSVPRVVASGTVTGSVAATIDITSIAATFTSLQLRLMLRGDTASSTVNCLLRFNNDSGANYDFQRSYAIGASLGGSQTFAATSMTMAAPNGASAPAAAFSPINVVIPAYSQTVTHKGLVVSMFSRFDVSSASLEQWAGSWRSTAAVSRITLTPAAGNWDIGSSWELVAT